MDQKHRDYCIRLGNPYYIKEREQQYEKFGDPLMENFIENDNNTDFNLQNGSKKVTN